MGPFAYIAIVHSERCASSRIDFADLDRAVSYGRDRAFDPLVRSVEITYGETVVWRADSLGEWVREVNAETQH